MYAKNLDCIKTNKHEMCCNLQTINVLRIKINSNIRQGRLPFMAKTMT